MFRHSARRLSSLHNLREFQHHILKRNNFQKGFSGKNSLVIDSYPDSTYKFKPKRRSLINKWKFESTDEDYEHKMGILGYSLGTLFCVIAASQSGAPDKASEGMAGMIIGGLFVGPIFYFLFSHYYVTLPILIPGGIGLCYVWVKQNFFDNK